MSDPMNNESTEAYEPLSDEQLDRLFKTARPTPPPGFEENLWKAIEPQLEQASRPSTELAVGGLRWLRQPWTAAAAAVVVILAALPFTLRQTPEAASRPGSDQLAAHSALETQPAPAKFGAGFTSPSDPPASPPPAVSTQTNQNQAPARMSAPRYQPPAASRSDAGLDAKVSKPAKSQEKLAANEALNADKAKRTPHYSAHDAQRLSGAQTGTPLDNQGEQLANLVEPIAGSVRQLKPGSYEIRIPAEHSQELEALLDRLPQPHNRLKRGLNEGHQKIYRVEILP